MKNWFKTPKSKLFKTIISIAIPLVAISILATVFYRPYSASETVAKPTSISASEQTYLIARSNIAPVSWDPSKEETAAGFYKVKAVPSNEIIKLIDNTDKEYTSVSVNPDNQVIAVAYPDSAGVIYASTLLPVQLDSIIAKVSESNAIVEIVPLSSPTPTVVVNRATVRSANTSNTTVTTVPGSQWSVTGTGNAMFNDFNNVITNPAGLGDSNPYIVAINAEHAAASNKATGEVFNFLSPFLILGFIVILFLIMRRVALNAEKKDKKGIVGEAKNTKESDTVPTTRFTDVAGCDEAIEDMEELVEYLRDAEKFDRVGAKPPHGALLVGPPGTGKTLLARAVAGEAGVPFYAVAGSDFVEMYVGVGAKRVRELFAKARKHPEGAIIFIDEIDAVARSRASGSNTASNSEAENTLNALLVEMDGFEKSRVIVLAATNRDDMLDKAILRPGRLERKIHIALPDRLGREKILGIYVKDRPIASDVDLNLMARRTPGMSGADLAQLVNEACLMAARAGRELVSVEDFDGAVATIAMGKARTSAVVTEHDRKVTAWHEAGHTVSAMVLPDADPPVSVSIIPRGPAGGITWMAPGDDLFLTRRRAFARLVVAMSGRAAEEIYLDGEFTSGPHGDLTAATETALAMVTKYGMTDAGLMIKSEGLLSTGSRVTDETIVAVEALLAEALQTARLTLATHKDLLFAIVEGLLENDTLILSDLNILEGKVDKIHPVLPSPPKEYRKEKAVVVDYREPVVVERVRFEAPVKRRGIRIGRVFISLDKKNGKDKGKAF